MAARGGVLRPTRIWKHARAGNWLWPAQHWLASRRDRGFPHEGGRARGEFVLGAGFRRSPARRSALRRHRRQPFGRAVPLFLKYRTRRTCRAIATIRLDMNRDMPAISRAARSRAARSHRQLRGPERGRPELGPPRTLVPDQHRRARAARQSPAQAELPEALRAHLIAGGVRHLRRPRHRGCAAQPEHALRREQGRGRFPAQDLRTSSSASRSSPCEPRTSTARGNNSSRSSRARPST